MSEDEPLGDGPLEYSGEGTREDTGREDTGAGRAGGLYVSEYGGGGGSS